MPQTKFNPDSFLAETATMPPGGGFDPDSFLAETSNETPAQPKQAENPHDTMKFLKRNFSGIGDMIGTAAKGAWNTSGQVGQAIMHPLDTASNIWDASGQLGQELVEHPADSLGKVTDSLGRIVRNTPLIGDALGEIEGSGKALVATIGGGSEAGQKAYADFQSQQKQQKAADANYNKEHPLGDFIEKSLPLLGMPEVIFPQISLLTLDTLHKSLAAGNSNTDAVHDALNTAILAGSMLGVGPVVAKGAGALGHLAAKEAGVSPESVSRYMEAPEAVNAAAKFAKDPEALKNLVDQRVSPINQDVEKARMGVDDARDLVADSHVQLPSADVDITSADAEAIKPQISEAQELLASRKQPPISLASEIPEHLDQQGAKLQALSMESLDRLAEEGKTFPTGRLSGAVTQKMNELKIGGVVPAVGPNATAYNALGKFEAMVRQIGSNTENGEIPAGTLKELIQNLDSVSKESYQTNAGALSPEAAKNFAQIRRTFDGVIKDASRDEAGVPIPGGYAEKMAELAPQVGLVSDMSKVFGNEQMALNSLKAAADPMQPKGYLVRKKLAEYDEMNGTNFGQRVEEYYDKPRANLKSLQDKQTSLELARQHAIAQHKQAFLDAKANAQRVLNDAKSTLEEKQAAAESVNMLGPRSTENVLKSIQGGRNIEARKQLQGLDPELAQTVSDAGVAKQFGKTTTNGSRKAKIGAGIGGAAGATAGGFMAGPVGAVVGGHIGGALGGLAGGLADVYGGQAVKVALDAGIKLEKLAQTPYIKPLMQAAQRSPKSLAVTHYMLSQTDPTYQDLTAGQ